MPNSPFIVVDRLSRTFKKGANDVSVFTNLTFSISQGEFIAILGPSGSGKTTILNLVAGFDRATTGTISVGGETITALSEAALSDWRSKNLGFIFQSHNLVSLLTAIENVEFPLRRLHMSAAQRRTRAEKALSLVGLTERKHHFPNELSGGEEQRVAIARAFVTDPKILIADEPTGNLDAVSAAHILQILQLLNKEHAKTIILVTHDQAAARFADRRLMLRKGVLESEQTTQPAA